MTIAKSVLNVLKGQGVDYSTVSHPRTFSSAETASAAHVDDDHIAKTVVVKDQRGYLLAVIPAGRWLDIQRLRDEMARDLHVAPEDEADELFPDCQPGAFPPLGEAYGLETVLDEALTGLAKVYFEAGDHEQLIVVTGEQFHTLMNGVRRGHFHESK
jgi:Ala-tRNA(Pro) deacylase